MSSKLLTMLFGIGVIACTILSQNCNSGGNEKQEISSITSALDTNPFVGTVGINLGNTLDGFTVSDSQYPGNYWNIGSCNAATGYCSTETAIQPTHPTKPQIDFIASQGFNYLRVPVTWHEYIGPNDTDTINPAWFNRIEQVIQWGIANNMYVCINIHHDNAWLFNSSKTDKSAKFANVWQQIANRFKSYDSHLIFEAMNEPRYSGCCNEYNGGEADGWAYIAKLNKMFLETVRGTGGNNTTRWLVLTPYGANIPTGGTQFLKNMLGAADAPGGINIFQNVGKTNIAVEQHIYYPWDFVTGTFSDWHSYQTEIDNQLNSLKTNFVDNGFAVTLDEYGAGFNSGNSPQIPSFAAEHVSRAKAGNFMTVWWDNNACGTGPDEFCLINRANSSVPAGYRASTLAAIMSAAGICTSGNCDGTPYGGTARTVPGTIQAEDYNVGANGYAYSTSLSNNPGGVYRNDQVGIEVTTDIGGGYNVGWITSGTWLKYTVNVASAGNYTVDSRVATWATGQSLHIEVDNSSVTSSVTLPQTAAPGNYQTWATVTAPLNIPLTAGQHVVKLYLESGSLNVNWIRFNLTTVPCTGDSQCVDNNPCTVDTCVSGSCQNVAGNASAVCLVAVNACDVAETCTGTSTTCPTDVKAADGATCNDGNACTQTDTCQTGVCTGSNPVVCPSVDQCHAIGVCNTSTGVCSAPTNLPNGTACNDGNLATCSDICTAGVCAGNTCPTYSGTSWFGTPPNLPTTINMGYYDKGGQGVAFNSSTAAQGGNTWRVSTDCQGAGNLCPTVEGSPSDVGWTTAGNWLNFLVNNPDAAKSYRIQISASSPNTPGANSQQVTITSTSLVTSATTTVGTVTVTNSGGWYNWTKFTAGTVTLPAGLQYIRVAEQSQGFNLQNLIVTAIPTNTPKTLPATIQAADYDNGGEGIAYHDSDGVPSTCSDCTFLNPVSSDPLYDSSHTVDVQGGASKTNIGYTTAGEYVNYTVSVPSSGQYNISFSVAATSAVTGAFHINSIQGGSTQNRGSVNVPNTSGWTTYQTVTLSNVTLAAGTQVLQIYTDQPGWNLKSFTVSTICTRVCTGKVCGASDGCGGICIGSDGATCPSGQTCNSSGTCVASGPCSGICSNPVVLTRGVSGPTGNNPTVSSPFCYSMIGAQGANCNGGTLNINGSSKTCNGGNISPWPGSVNGGYCFYSSTGLWSGWISLW